MDLFCCNSAKFPSFSGIGFGITVSTYNAAARQPEPVLFQKFSFLTSIFFFGLAWAASSGIRLNTEWHKAEKRRRESENERLQVELKQLKSQLNPHFLFNTLNGIYTLTLTKTDSASNAVLLHSATYCVM